MPNLNEQMDKVLRDSILLRKRTALHKKKMFLQFLRFQASANTLKEYSKKDNV